MYLVYFVGFSVLENNTVIHYVEFHEHLLRHLSGPRKISVRRENAFHLLLKNWGKTDRETNNDRVTKIYSRLSLSLSGLEVL